LLTNHYTVEVNNTLIYFISRPIMPPVDPLQAALPSLNLSSFLAAVFSTALADTLKTTPRTTILIPHNSAFERLGMLVSDHLLAASSKSDLLHVILHHTIDGVHYAQSLRNVTGQSFPTVDGSDLRISNRTVTSSGGWSGMNTELKLRNLLTNTGVVHELSDILIPRSVDLTVGKLAKAAKGTTMTTMLSKAGFDWVLNATAPPEGSPWANHGLDGAGWTLLCPPDDALKRLNLIALYQDVDRLREIVSQHLIPAASKSWAPAAGIMEIVNNNRPLSLANGATYTTLLSSKSVYGDILIRESEGSLVLGIKGARGTDGRGDWAKVISWGRTTTGNGVGGVIAIDRMLVPYSPPWWVEYGQPIGGGIIGTILIGLFFLGVRAVWNRCVTHFLVGSRR
jgi:solute carrier family 25 carnitine/acylcarnitine transporter 20/29